MMASLATYDYLTTKINEVLNNPDVRYVGMQNRKWIIRTDKPEIVPRIVRNNFIILSND
jgi:hypothetical protein